jgi:hypothetical protein
MKKAHVTQRRQNLPLGQEDGALDLGFVGRFFLRAGMITVLAIVLPL